MAICLLSLLLYRFPDPSFFPSSYSLSLCNLHVKKKNVRPVMFPTSGFSLCLVVQSCPTVCDRMDFSLPGSSVHRDSPGQSTGVGSLSFLQSIFPTQGSNPGLPRSRQILYHLSHQGSPVNKPIITNIDTLLSSTVYIRVHCTILWVLRNV